MIRKILRGITTFFIAIFLLGIIGSFFWESSYDEYLELAKMARVQTNYEDAVRFTRQRFVEEATRAQQGKEDTTPQSVSEWIAVYKLPPGILSPGGAPAYSAVANATSGTIHIQADAGTVTISRPAYLELTAEMTIINGTLEVKRVHRELSAEASADTSPDG